MGIKFYLFLITLLILIGAGWLIYGADYNSPKAEQLSLTIAGAMLEAEVADNEQSRILGLSGRTLLPAGRAMLFVYDRTGYYGIWMKDMNFPIDVIWLDADRKVIDISAKIGPENFPTIYRPKKPVRYLLEVNAGWTDQYNIQPGDQAEF